MCFKFLKFFLVNWCQHWFQYYPLPPLNVLAMIENVLIEHDPDLVRHFAKNNIRSDKYIWPLLEVVFSESLSSENWCILWDHVLTNEPSFLLMAPAAYNIINRSILFSLTKPEQFDEFYHNQHPVDLKKIIHKTYYLLNNTNERNHPRQYLHKVIALDQNNYPTFSGYPKIVLNYADGIDRVEQSERNMSFEKSSIYTIRRAIEQEADITEKTEIENQRMKGITISKYFNFFQVYREVVYPLVSKIREVVT